MAIKNVIKYNLSALTSKVPPKLIIINRINEGNALASHAYFVILLFINEHL